MKPLKIIFNIISFCIEYFVQFLFAMTPCAIKAVAQNTEEKISTPKEKQYINPTREFFDGPFANDLSANMLLTDLELEDDTMHL